MMKKGFLFILAAVLCLLTAVSFAETVTVPKAIIVPEKYSDVPESYKSEFNINDGDMAFYDKSLSDDVYVSVLYDLGEYDSLNAINYNVSLPVTDSRFTSRNCRIVGFMNKYDFFIVQLSSNEYDLELYCNMDGTVFTAYAYEHATCASYVLVLDREGFIGFPDPESIIYDQFPFDLSTFEIPAIAYGDELVVFPDGGMPASAGTLVPEDGVFRYYENGAPNTEKFGFVPFEGGSFLVANGAVANVNGLVNDPEHPSDWYYCAGGQVQKVTDLVEYDSEWFYVKDGKLDTTLNGYVEYDGALFYVAAGQLQRGVNGLAQDPNTGVWYFCSGGQVQAYTGLAEYDGAWFYVENGLFDPNYYGTVTHNGAEFVVVAGQPVL